MTRAGQGYQATLQERAERFESALESEQDPIKRAVAVSWLDATRAALLDFILALPEIEAEAFFGVEMAA